jgi:cytoskeleton protein RodZ
MPTIGETLREARMRQRLDIADVEERTKIRAKYLRALENEEFGLLPGSTFVKTFLRTYAEVLGLDPHVLVEEYRASHEPVDELEAQSLGGPAPGGVRERERRYPGPPRPGTLIALGIAAVLVFLVILGSTNEDEDGGDRASRTETAERKNPARRRRRPAPAPAAVSLRVAPTVPTYACLDNGPGTDVVFEGILQEARTFKGRKLRINLGKSSVQLRANGRSVPLESTPNPVGYEFSTTGSKELPPGQRPCA